MKKLNTLFLIMVVSTMVFLDKGIVGACDSTNVDLTLIGVEIPVSTATGTQSLPEVAYDDINNRYIVVWRDDRGTGLESIYAQLIDSTGSLINSEVLITTENFERAVVAFGSTSGKYLAVYAASFDSLYGQFIDKDGNLSGAAFEINNTSGMIPSISYNSHNNTFLVVYRIYANNGHDIYGRRIDGSTGALIGGEIAIATSSDDENAPSTAYNNDANQWLVTWVRYGVEGGNIAQIINGSTGALIGGQRNLSSSYGFGEVVYDKDLKIYFILSFPNLKGMLLGPTNLNVLACDIPINVDAVSCQAVDAGIAYNPTRKEYFMVWHRNADPQAPCIPPDPSPSPWWPEPELDIYGQRFKVTYPVNPFVFSTISSPQQVGVPFNVTITAADSTFDGQVSLTSSLGAVSPTSVNIVDGQASVSVRLYNPGNTRLKWNWYGKYGYSKYFDVTGACIGKIFGRVVDANDDVVYQADVNLCYSDGQPVAPHMTQKTDAEGKFVISSVACGNYSIKVEKSGSVTTVSDIAVAGTLPLQLDNPPIKLQLNCGTEGTPVILVPGIMGSTVFTIDFPLLSKEPPSKNLKIWDISWLAGWKQLRDELKGANFRYLDCPWDWRLRCEDAYKEYLTDKIDEALKDPKSTTGKVHIVAHSTGRLMVRAYIQGENYRNDIDKVAFVGTPHEGSCNAYYIWEGGNPKAVDDITDSGFIQFSNPYSNTLERLWIRSSFWGILTWNNWRHGPIRDFVRKNVPSLRQLMYTDNFLYDEKLEPWEVSTPGNENLWLKTLNQGDKTIEGTLYAKPSDRMSKDGNGKVQVRLFVGYKEDSTIRYVETLSRDNPKFKDEDYEDGRPKWPYRFHAEKKYGDGTVPYESARRPAKSGWASLQEPKLSGKHLSLIKTYKAQIKEFLKGGAVASMSTDGPSAGAKITELPSSEISFSIFGDMRLCVTDPLNKNTGIDPVSGNPVAQVAFSSSSFSSEGGGVSVENPGQGSYIVTYFGEAERDFQVGVGYADSSTSETFWFRGFRPDTPRSFTVSVSPSATPHIAVTLPVKTPTGLGAEPYSSSSSLCTRLSWTASSESGITGYNIYSVGELDPYFAKLVTVPVGSTSYDTTHLWSGDSSTPFHSYAVTAVKADGAESFFSDLAQNNDRDHDGLTDVEEASQGTNPQNPDSDGDALNDGEELSYGTNPLVKDTDGDTFSDYDEIQAGSDPLDPDSIPSVIPTITSFTPTSAGMGKTVVIIGTNFTGTEVKFGGIGAASFTVDSPTQITAVVGAGATGKVTVTTAWGTATSTSTFTYIATFVPTLNEWGLIILSLLMIGVGYITIRRRKSASV